MTQSREFICKAALPRIPGASPILHLPHVFADVIREHSQRQCVFCQKTPEEAALCLCCGTIVCCMNEKCVHTGVDSCRRHGASCSSGSAVFLLLRACTVLIVLENDRHCDWGSVYLDAHEEEDRYLRRGKSMFLNTKRYQDLQQLVAVGTFVHDNKVVSSLIRYVSRVF